jgi:hypothetical protein
MANQPDFSNLIDKDKYQVFLFKSRAIFPFIFAMHPWFVLNKKGEISRWEVEFASSYIKHGSRWGYLHENLCPIFQGTEVITYMDDVFHPATLLGKVEGELAQKMIDFINSSPEIYKHWNKYHVWGPNSNTFAQWVINKFPECKWELPDNAYGKNFKFK